MQSIPEHIRPADFEVEPIERAETIPSTWYTNRDQTEIENRAIFSREWQLVGHESQVAKPGESLCRTIAGNPILIVRDNEMKIRAFYNVCRHRGGPIAVKSGTTTVLQCQYHGWTYLMDGSLRGVPQFDRVELFDKKDFGLKPVKLKIWQGLMFVSLGKNPPPFEPVVEGIDERIRPIKLGDMKYYMSTTDLINCNWKVYVDNFLEGYHIPIVHPELAGLLDYRNYITETSDLYSLQFSPFTDKSENNPYGAEDGKAFYYFIYPNFMLNILPGRLQLNIIEPVGHDRCRVIFDYFYTDIEGAKQKGLAESDIQYSTKIQEEDIEICEAVQRGLKSDAYDKGRFSVKRELGVWHFQSLVKQSLQRYFDE